MIPINIAVESKLKRTARVMQLEGMFDVPPRETLRHEWKGSIPIDEKEWNVGLIVGPSGSGKTSVAHQLFDEPTREKWEASSVIDDFDKSSSIQDVTNACSAVGFNTIPSWMKPYKVLSTGEKFRVEIARALLERKGTILVDEFTSVVDRQVAKIGSFAVQKFIRKYKRQFVAASCHYDIIEWLQPDWTLEPATMTFQWRSVQRRPALDIEIARVHHSAWRLFAPFHYLTAELSNAAACHVLFVNEIAAAFVGVLHLPHGRIQDMKRISRIVTLPDYQGLGLAMILAATMGAAYKTLGYRFRNYPAHPSFIRSHDRSPDWALVKIPGIFSPPAGLNSTINKAGAFGRPCAGFEYVGAAMQDQELAKSLIDGQKKTRPEGRADLKLREVQTAR